MSDKLKQFLEAAAAAPVELTVRELLAKWDVRIRNFNTVPRIRADLDNAGLTCDPPFDDVDLSTIVCVSSKETVAEQDETADESELSFPHAALLVSDIPSASREVVSIPPDATLAQARAVMMSHGYSQLPVITEAGVLVGTVSWERIGHIQVSIPNAELSDVIDRHPNIVKLNEELLKKIPTIYEAGFVLVRNHEEDICGIVTTADLTEQFRLLAEPFFLVGEIERRLRRCIERAFSAEDLQCVGKSITSVNNMTFGQYVRFLRTDGIWPRLGWQIDCKLFTEQLDHIRQVRNDIMHFRPDPLTGKQRDSLAKFTAWMRHLDPRP
ncbi:CBS domain-containing protein [Microbispora sp. NEAU-D428]|uniref:CBS domain-containing protein n=1 Tax=Microbispora sitophila TaxID=2771537 RepID=UPI001868C8DF|nr:CBS domain-containing protein [Microbispora sitophila]MBE3016078.1 CBS domain-containing protein [Microbispora sitophila]